MPFKDGDFILIHYTVKVVEEGREVVKDTTREDVARKAGIYDPNRVYGEYLVVVGKSRLIDALDEAIRSMNVGEKRVIEAPPEKAYGERREDLIMRVPIKQLKRHNIPVRVGQEVNIGGRIGRITRVTERFAYIDFNHPLAGKTLKIEVEVLKKLETVEEKVKYLAARRLGIPPGEVKVEEANGNIVVMLPNTVLGIADLDSVLQLISRDVHETINPKSLRICINIEYPPTEGEEGGGKA